MPMTTATLPSPAPVTETKKRRLRWAIAGAIVLVLISLLVAARLAMPYALRWYVNRVIDRNPLYEGEIGTIDVNLWRGAYSIHDVRLLKTTGKVPVPLFSASKVDLQVEWNALIHRK